MAQVTGIGRSSSEVRRPNFDWLKTWLIRLLFAAIGLLVGLYILAPRQLRSSDVYLPASFTKVPTGIVQLTQENGSGVLLPVRIADTSQARGDGLRGVGSVALNNVFFLYAQSRETTSTTSYNLADIRANLEFAVIDAKGTVIAIYNAPVGTARLSVPENHLWALAAKAGSFEPYGIMVGTSLDPEKIRKLNF
jgi:uncharacterized membrane protein (UPF0127 family)